MSTKDDCLSFKDKAFVDSISDNQYSNLNLNNQNHRCVFEEIFRPKNVASDNKKLQNYELSFSNDLRAKKDLNSWNKCSKELSLNCLNIDRNLKEENEFSKAKSANNSTLSLHIEAYENSIETKNDSDGSEKEVKSLAMVKKWGDLNPFVDGSTFIAQNTFEFPRQQENGPNHPEMMRFAASQYLLNPNQMDDANNQGRPPPKYFNMMSRFPPPSRPPLQQQPPSEKAMRSVYVGNIGFDVNEEELKQILSKIGTIIGFRIVHDRETGKSKGFGFCEFMDPETAQRCIRQLNNIEFKGRNLRLDSAVLNERAMNDEFVPSSSHNPMSSMPPLRNQSPHNETSMYGPAPLNGKTPEAIAKTLSKCSPEVMFELMRDMKNLATTNPQRCRQLLETNPQLAFSLLQAQIMMHWLDTDAAFNLIDRKTNQEKAAELPPAGAAAPPLQEPSHAQSRQPLRPTPSQAPAPFRPPPPPQSDQQLQFFQHTPPAQQQPFRQQFFPPPQQQSAPPQRPPPSSAGPWSGGPPQRMPNAPPPQRFPHNQNFDRFPPPSSNDGPGFNENFRNFGNRPSGPPSNFHNMPPQQRGHFPPSQSGFRPPPPSHQQQHFQPPPQRRSEDVPPPEDDAEDYEMIEQLLQLTDDQINQLPAHEAEKIREIRAQLAHR